jgi:hypothetical protein
MACRPGFAGATLTAGGASWSGSAFAVGLERRLRELGWDITVTPMAGPFFWGAGNRARPAAG